MLELNYVRTTFLGPRRQRQRHCFAAVDRQIMDSRPIHTHKFRQRNGTFTLGKAQDNLHSALPGENCTVEGGGDVMTPADMINYSNIN